MSDLKEILDLIKQKLAPIAEEELGDLAHALISDADSFLAESADDLAKWTQRLAAGEMSAEGFEFALRSRPAVLQMKALTEAGITQIRLEKLRAALIEVVVSTVREALHV